MKLVLTTLCLAALLTACGKGVPQANSPGPAEAPVVDAQSDSSKEQGAPVEQLTEQPTNRPPLQTTWSREMPGAQGRVVSSKQADPAPNPAQAALKAVLTASPSLSARERSELYARLRQALAEYENSPAARGQAMGTEARLQQMLSAPQDRQAYDAFMAQLYRAPQALPATPGN